MHWQTAAAEQVLTRGVWIAPYRFQGSEVLIAVDSKGDVRKHLKLLPGVSYARAIAALERWLDDKDPVPQLRLIKPEPPAYDPRCEDHLAHALRLARRNAGRFTQLSDCVTTRHGPFPSR